MVRFAASPLTVDWARSPETEAARAAESARLALEGEAMFTRDALMAVSLLRRALDLAPADTALRHKLADAFERLGDPDAALTLHRETLHRDTPGEPKALFDIGRILHATLERRGPAELTEAVAAWKALLAKPPAMRWVDRARRGLPALEAALLRKSPPPATPAAPQAKARPEAQSRAPTEERTPGAVSPEDADDALLAGNALMERGMFQEAAKAYARVLRDRPGDEEARWLLGVANARAGAAAEALRSWAPLHALSGAKTALTGARRALYLATKKEAETKR